MFLELSPFLLLAFAMGLRHGLDPDHLAIINGVSIQENEHKQMSKWNGFMFSLGHGLTVTFIGLIIAGIAGAKLIPLSILSVTEWIPICLLLFTGFYNLYFIINSKHNGHAHAEKIKNLGIGAETSHGKMIMIGILFALVFDTASQTATWAIVAQQNDKVTMSLAIGLVFTIGMMVTDTANGLLFSYAYQKNKKDKTLETIQQLLGWLIALTSLLLGFHQLLEKCGINIPIDDSVKTVLGILIFVFIIITGFYRFIPSKIKMFPK